MDEARRVVVDPVIIQARLFPYEPSADIIEMMRPIVEAGRLIVYETDSVLHGFLPHWHVTSGSKPCAASPTKVPREWLSPDVPGVKKQKEPPSHVRIYEEEYQAALGLRPAITVPDAVALAKVAREHPDDYVSIVRAYVSLHDDWIRDNGYSGRFLPGQVNRLLLFIRDEKERAAKSASAWR